MFYCFSVCSELMYWVAVLFIRLCAKSRFEVLWVQNVLSYLGFILGKLRLPCSIPVSYRVDFHCILYRSDRVDFSSCGWGRACPHG